MNTAAIYRVGTLKYTQAGLVTLFVWLLWGDFCYNLMLQIMPQLMPLFLNRYGASPELISILMIMFPEAVNLLLNPIISTASDRTRTRWGRRRHPHVSPQGARADLRRDEVLHQVREPR